MTSECDDAGCKKPDDPKKMFPGLEVLPRPEPNPALKGDHDSWLQEYNQWSVLRCPCGRGYFCREHGSWITKEDVIAGTAATADEQKKGSCPTYHYEGQKPFK
ncbi:hypothetical protein O1611_g2630 [Lasiodiplodia mahajangana]|uniref:Uncharacterized protein n=1 Tax=Lasiodiplodia mahajangana TaxID=1108764 RepID=A0ACC2JUC4_9PEZI|nr:hypothetical protein O1611_g2630 [Lasiodiplodia mahajangana]